MDGGSSTSTCGRITRRERKRTASRSSSSSAGVIRGTSLGMSVSDAHIIDPIQLLAETEWIFTEPAGGTTLAGAIDLIQRGIIPRDESLVVCVTGNGYKTAEVVSSRLAAPVRLSRAFKEFEAWWEARQAIA